MSQADFWYIRFPDGRILRAASTKILRHELKARRIPLASTVRRSPSDEWVALEWTREFADLVETLAARPTAGKTPAPPTVRHTDGVSVGAMSRHSAEADADHPATVGSRLDASRLHLIGVRGYLDELLAALDSTLVPKKLLLGLIAGILLGVFLVLARAAWLEPKTVSQPTAWLLLAAVLLVFVGVCALLTRLTYLELARLRPAHWSEGWDGLGRLTAWVVVSQMIVWGAFCALLLLLRWLPFWLSPELEESWSLSRQVLAGSALSLCTGLEVLLYPVVVLWWLLPPLLAVETCTVWNGLSQWLNLLRGNLGQALLYQSMAAGLGVLVSIPFLLLIAPLFLPTFHAPEGLQDVAGATRCVLLGLACTPMLTFWTTSNVFIYLNIRYGSSSRR
jgi:hypothetical protein